MRSVLLRLRGPDSWALRFVATSTATKDSAPESGSAGEFDGTNAGTAGGLPQLGMTLREIGLGPFSRARG